MIPDFSMAGIVPPIRPWPGPGVPPTSHGASFDRSPFRVELIDLVDRFATSAPRAQILQGFLNYRAELHKAGLCLGFQWLDGSFLEDIEQLEGRPPSDIDVVSFYVLPRGQSQATLFPMVSQLMDCTFTKSTYSVDAYGVGLDRGFDAQMVREICYWYSMWSHRRSGLWKGFLEVDLAPHGDAAGQAHLSQKIAAGFVP